MFRDIGLLKWFSIQLFKNGGSPIAIFKLCVEEDAGVSGAFH